MQKPLAGSLMYNVYRRSILWKKYCVIFQDHVGRVPHKKATKSHSVSGTSLTAITTGSGLRKYDF